MLSIARHTYALLNRISPTLSSLIAGWYSTVTGWRFDDIKSFIASNTSSMKNTISVIRSLKIIENSDDQDRLAFVSPLPPSDTGIASCTYYTFKGGEEPIDIFFPSANDEDFLLMSKVGS